MFRITSSKGFHIEFPNGVVLSTQFGGANYCSNYDIDIGSERNLASLSSYDAEIAIWKGTNKDWITGEMQKEVFGVNEGDVDDVMGRVNISQWLQIFDWCRRQL